MQDRVILIKKNLAHVSALVQSLYCSQCFLYHLAWAAPRMPKHCFDSIFKNHLWPLQSQLDSTNKSKSDTGS